MLRWLRWLQQFDLEKMMITKFDTMARWNGHAVVVLSFLEGDNRAYVRFVNDKTGHGFWSNIEDLEQF